MIRAEKPDTWPVYRRVVPINAEHKPRSHAGAHWKRGGWLDALLGSALIYAAESRSDSKIPELMLLHRFKLAIYCP